MMKNLNILKLGIASFLAFCALEAGAQATATGHISAEVIEAITAVESTPMNFGSFTVGDQSGSIILPASGSVVSTSTVVSAGSAICPATFSVSGAKDATFSVTLPGGPTTLTNLDGAGTLVVTDWTATSEQGKEDYVLAGGSQKVKVGATLNFGTIDENPKGTYTGSYQVTFAYN
jgi:hypothetical protein